MSGILALGGHVDDGACLVGVVPLGADALHHLPVAYAYSLSVYLRADAMAGYFLHISHLATVRRFVRECLA